MWFQVENPRFDNAKATPTLIKQQSFSVVCYKSFDRSKKSFLVVENDKFECRAIFRNFDFLDGSDVKLEEAPNL